MEAGIEDARAHVQRAIEDAVDRAWSTGFDAARRRLEDERARQPHAPRAWWASVAQIAACARWSEAQWRALATLPGWAARTCLAEGGIEPGDGDPARWIARRARARAREIGIEVSARSAPTVKIGGWPRQAWEEAPLGAALACAAAGHTLESDAEWGAACALEWEMALGGETAHAKEAARKTLEGAKGMRRRLEESVRRKALETLAWEVAGDLEGIARGIEQRWNGHGGGRARDAMLGADEEGRAVWEIAIEHPMEALASARGWACARGAAHEMRAHRAMLVSASDPDSAWVVGRRRRTGANEASAHRARACRRAIAEAIDERQGGTG